MVLKHLELLFTDKSSKEEIINKLKELDRLKAYFENADDVLLEIDIETEGDYESECNQLYQWENEGILSYETCEASAEGKFDDEQPS